MTAPQSAMSNTAADQKVRARPGPITGGQVEEVNCGQPAFTKRKCGCLKTSDKLKEILGTFPTPPPPTPMTGLMDKACGYNYGHPEKQYNKPMTPGCCTSERKLKRHEPKAWRVLGEVVGLVQLSVTATALALYYLIYCYMQLVYYILRSALYFHNADGPMKITIGVVTVTSLIIGFNILMRMEKIIGIVY